MAAVLSVARAVAQLPAPTSFGPVQVNPLTPATQSLSFQFSGLTAAPTLSLRYGIDFAAGALSCNSGWTSCTLSVNFSPKYAGLRQDAVMVTDAAGNFLGSAFVYGTGLGTQVAFSPGVFNPFRITIENDQSSQGLAIDNAGNRYISDSYNNVVVKIAAGSGANTIVAGVSQFSGNYSGDGGPATSAYLRYPYALAFDAAGNLYLCDQGNQRVRRVDATTGIITTVAGNGTSTFSGDGGPATSAGLYQPVSLAVDARGNLYIGERGTGDPHEVGRVRLVTAATGTISTIAGGNGTYGCSGDGGLATSAELRDASGLALDAAGNLYIADRNCETIRRVDALTGHITTVAGNGTEGYSGDGSAAVNAELNSPQGVAVDAAGNLYIADYYNDVIRRVDAATQLISTIEGNHGLTNPPSDGYPASMGEIPTPSTVAIDAAGNLYAQGFFGTYALGGSTTTLLYPVTNAGSTSVPQTVNVTNIGNQPLHFTGISVSGNFTLQPNGAGDCLSSGTLAAGASCAVSATFTPPENGIFAGTLTLTDDALNQTGAQQQVTLQGPGPQAILSSDHVSFGAAAIGSFGGNYWLTIRNPGNAPLQFSSIAFSGPNAADFSIDPSNDCKSGISGQSGCSLDIYFTPQGTASRTASLVISDNAPDSPQTVALSGTGLVPANLVLSPSTLTFGSQAAGTTSAPQLMTLTNAGGAALRMTLAVVTGQGFVQGTSSCPSYGQILFAGASCTVAISFAPKQTGNLNGSVTVLWTDYQGRSRVQSAAISGIGVGQTQIPGLLRQVAAGADGAVWGINRFGQIYLYNADSQSWQNIPGALAQIAVGSSSAVWGINAAGSIYRWNASAQTWDWIPGTLSRIAAGADGDVWGLNAQGRIWHFDPLKQTWNGITGTLAQIAVGFDGAVWGLDSANRIFRFNPGSQLFQQVPGSLTQIAVGADGDAWGLNSSEEIYHFNPLTQSWDQSPGWLVQISAGSASNVWGVNASGDVYQFSTQTQSWVGRAGRVSKISAAANGAVWGLDSADNIYQYTPATQPMQTWHPIPGSLAQISVGADGNTWGISGSGQVLAFNPQTQTWNGIPGELTQLAVGFGGDVWGLDRTGQVWHYNPSIQNWDSMPGNLAQIAVGANGDVWGIDSWHQIWRYNASISNWDNIPGSLVQLSVGADGAVWGVNIASEIYQFNPSTQSWNHIPGNLKQVSAGSSQNVWGVNWIGEIWRFNFQTHTWENVPGSLASISVAFDGTVCGINSIGAAWRYHSSDRNWEQLAGPFQSIAVASGGAIWGVNSSGDSYQYW